MQGDPDEEHRRDHGRERELRQEPREVRLERVRAVQHGARDLTGLHCAEPAGPRAHQLREHASAQGRERRRRGERSTTLERPSEHTAGDGDRSEGDERALERIQALVPQKRARDDPSEQRCLRDDHRRRQQGECPTRSEVPTHGRHLPHEPRVERAHPYGEGAGAERRVRDRLER